MRRVLVLLLVATSPLAAQGIAPRASFVLGVHRESSTLPSNRPAQDSWLPQLSAGITVGRRLAIDVATRRSLGRGAPVHIQSLGVAVLPFGPSAFDFRLAVANIQTYSGTACERTEVPNDPPCPPSQFTANRGRIGVDVSVGVERPTGRHSAVGATMWFAASNDDGSSRGAYQSIGLGLRIGWR